MKKNKKNRKEVVIDGQRWGSRELAQIIRRRMITRGDGATAKKYTRKVKHKTGY